MYPYKFNKYIELIRDDVHRRFLVNVELQDRFGRSEDYPFVLDTGCNGSTADLLLKRMFKFNDLGTSIVNQKKEIKLLVPLIKLDKKLEYKNVEMPFIDYSSYDKMFGLIGMDILGNYDFYISLEENRLYLKETKNPFVNARIPDREYFLSNIAESEYEESLRVYERQYMSGTGHSLEEIQRHIEERD